MTLGRLRRIQAVAEDDPKDGGVLAVVAWVTGHTGDVEAAARLRSLALVTTEGVPTLELDVQTAPTCDPSAWVASSADLHGPWAFRRKLPLDLMPPDVRCLVFSPAVTIGAEQAPQQPH